VVEVSSKVVDVGSTVDVVGSEQQKTKVVESSLVLDGLSEGEVFS
jgi:hypothetical protein